MRPSRRAYVATGAAVSIIIVVWALSTTFAGPSPHRSFSATLGVGGGGTGGPPLALRGSGTLVAAAISECKAPLKMVKAAESAATIDAVIKEAAGGETVCMEEGSYPNLGWNGGGTGRASYMTLRPKGNASVTVNGISSGGTHFLRIEKLHFTEGIYLKATVSNPETHDDEILNNTWENSLSGIGLISEGATVKRIVVEHNYMHKIHLEIEEGVGCKPGSGKANGTGVEMGGEGITVKHNTFNDVQWHYLQGGDDGTEPDTVEYNDFVNGLPVVCEAHLNTWQIFGQPYQHNIFRNNVMWHAGQIPLQWENEAKCENVGTHNTVENNLDITNESNAVQLSQNEEIVFSKNTFVKPVWAVKFSNGGACGNWANVTVTKNLVAEKTGSGGEGTVGFVTPGCTTACTWSENASDNSPDATVEAFSATVFAKGIPDEWFTAEWNPLEEIAKGNLFPDPPAGYYRPHVAGCATGEVKESGGTGACIKVGYEGTIGP